MRACVSMASAGHEVTLLCGKGSLETQKLFQFYNICPNSTLKIIQLPILRRNNALKIQCNFLFFWQAQRFIKKSKPDFVISSVLKQADFHLKRRVKNCHYIYEVHQLAWYPTFKENVDYRKVKKEKEMLERCDLITVTTDALKRILENDPYRLDVPIQKVPLACDFDSLKSQRSTPSLLNLFYVGQLYESQGLQRLLKALKGAEGIELTVVGGKPSDVQKYKNYCQELGLGKKVIFMGFYPTEKLPKILEKADAFITTFDNSERMPYVAHTKLHEYQAWKKPIIAPNLEVVRDHLDQGALLYEVHSEDSLKQALLHIQNESVYKNLLEEALQTVPFTWKKRGFLFNKLLNKVNKAKV